MSAAAIPRRPRREEPQLFESPAIQSHEPCKFTGYPVNHTCQGLSSSSRRGRYSNPMRSFRAYTASAAIGVVAGLRSMTAPAIVSRAAASGDLRIEQPGLKLLGSAASANTFAILAAGEILADKTSYIPNRIDPAPLIGRILTGGLCGAAICSAKRQSVVLGSILGGCAAIGGTFLGYHLRKSAVRNRHIPDLKVALAEDAIAVGGALTAIASVKEQVNRRSS
jgi:uncharacterized membrane protein